MSVIEIIKISKDIEDEPIEYNVKILGKQEESQKSTREKLEELKKELEKTILFKHPAYGASISFSNPNRSKLIVKVNFLWRNYAKNTIKEIARKQNFEI